MGISATQGAAGAPIDQKIDAGKTRRRRRLGLDAIEGRELIAFTEGSRRAWPAGRERLMLTLLRYPRATRELGVGVRIFGAHDRLALCALTSRHAERPATARMPFRQRVTMGGRMPRENLTDSDRSRSEERSYRIGQRAMNTPEGLGRDRLGDDLADAQGVLDRETERYSLDARDARVQLGEVELVIEASFAQRWRERARQLAGERLGLGSAQPLGQHLQDGARGSLRLLYIAQPGVRDHFFHQLAMRHWYLSRAGSAISVPGVPALVDCMRARLA
jgi:hypothetical protein